MNFDIKPKQETGHVSLRLPASLLSEIAVIQAETGATKTNVITAAVAKGLQALKSPAASSTTGLL